MRIKEMLPIPAIREMAYIKRITLKDLSLSLGKSSAYINATTGNGSHPQIDNYIRIANACGFTIVLENKEEDIRIILTDEQNCKE